MYKVELWCDMFKIKEFETEDFDVAKKCYIEFSKMMGATIFYIDGKGMSIEWMYENLLNLDYRKIEAEHIAKIEEIKRKLE